MRHPIVTLSQDIAGRLREGHPWVFADAVRHSPSLEAGDIVEVRDSKGDWVGRGVIDPQSPLRVRIWTRHHDQDLDRGLLAARIKAAIRRRPFPDAQTDGYRVLHGEGDRLPGLVCDRYGAVGVLRPDGPAAERWMIAAKEELERLLGGVEHWAIRRSERWRGARPSAEWLGEPPETVPVWFREHGMALSCDPIEGQKTGFFLDQRANRQRVASYCAGKRLLNLFGYTGGFSLAAALHGASRTVTVDQSQPALEAARVHFERNGIPHQAHGFEAADVWAYLEQFGDGAAPFEVAVCDPPSLVKRRRDLQRGWDGYVRLFGEVLRAMPTGSLVALASCSSHVDRQRFGAIVRQAAQAARCELVAVGCFSADVDHPSVVGFEEGDYLQCMLAWLTRD